MKFLTDRTEIAKAINIEKLPVIRINIEKCMEGYNNCYAGDKVVAVRDDMEIRCRVNMYGDEKGNEDWLAPWTYKTISLMPETIGLTARFGYTDVMEMAEWNRCPRVRANQEVIVIFYNDKKGVCIVRKMRVGDRVEKFVYPTVNLVDVEE